MIGFIKLILRGLSSNSTPQLYQDLENHNNEFQRND